MAQIFLIGKMYYSDLRIKGRRIRRALDTDKTTALQKLQELIEIRRAGRLGRAPKNLSWETFKKEYLEWSKKSKAYPTFVHERIACKMLEKSHPLRKITDVTPNLLDKVNAKWKGSKWSIPTVNRRIRALKTMMRKGEAWGYIAAQNWRSVTAYEEDRGRIHYWTEQEIPRLLRVCHGPWETICRLGYAGGMRRGEIWSREKTDVDFARNRIHIDSKPGWNTKSHENRFVPMPPRLRAHLRQVVDTVPGKYLIADAEGKRPSLATMSVYFARLVKKAGLTGGIHTLRHTYGAWMVSSGKSLYIVQKLMGHSNPKITEIYAHLMPKTLDEAIEGFPG